MNATTPSKVQPQPNQSCPHTCGLSTRSSLLTTTATCSTPRLRASCACSRVWPPPLVSVTCITHAQHGLRMWVPCCRRLQAPEIDARTGTRAHGGCNVCCVFALGVLTRSRRSAGHASVGWLEPVAGTEHLPVLDL